MSSNSCPSTRVTSSMARAQTRERTPRTATIFLTSTNTGGFSCTPSPTLISARASRPSVRIPDHTSSRLDCYCHILSWTLLWARHRAIHRPRPVAARISVRRLYAMWITPLVLGRGRSTLVSMDLWGGVQRLRSRGGSNRRQSFSVMVSATKGELHPLFSVLSDVLLY
jgi:hypothetical protein